jgi:small subunit ribosomal protein S6
MTIVTPDVSEEELTGVLNQVVSYVTNAGGTLIDMSRESPWGRRRLAYPIRHGGRDVRDGFYTLYHFRIDPSRVIEVERDLKLNERIIRYLIVTYTPKVTEGAAGTVPAEATPSPEAATESAGEPVAQEEAAAESGTEEPGGASEASEEA